MAEQGILKKLKPFDRAQEFEFVRPAAMNIEYEDFELEISSSRPFEYLGRVVGSPVGQSVRCPVRFKFAEEPKDFEILRLTIENAVLRGSDEAGNRGPLSQSEQVLREFGCELFRSIFVDAGPIRDAYAQSKGRLTSDGRKYLRIKLRIEPPELSALPWEYLCDKDETPDYLGLRLPVVRSIDMFGVTGQMHVNGPLRILGMIANPGTPEWPSLDEPAERRRIANGIDKLEREKRIIFEWVPGGTPTDLLSKLMEDEWHIFHFIGHGGVEASNDLANGNSVEDTGYIVLLDEYGQPVKQFASDLAVLLATPQRSLRLAVLNCCESGKTNVRDRFGNPALTLIRSGIPAVVAMQFPIRDKTAIKLAEGFYRSLANNYPVDTAVMMARRFIRSDSRLEWAIPVLYMHASDGKIFEVHPAAATAPLTPELPGPAPAQTSSEVLGDQLELDADERLRQFMQLADPGRRELTDLETRAKIGRKMVEDNKADKRLSAMVGHTYYELSRAQLAQNTVPKAAASLSYAIELAPSEPEYRVRRSNLYARVGFYELALGDITEAIRIMPENAEYHWMKGIVYGMMSASTENPSVLKDALAAFGTAIKFDPNEPKYIASRANALFQIARYKEALADIDKAILLSPDNPDLLAMKAKMTSSRREM